MVNESFTVIKSNRSGKGNGKGNRERKREKKARSRNGEGKETRAKDNTLPGGASFISYRHISKRPRAIVSRAALDPLRLAGIDKQKEAQQKQT